MSLPIHPEYISTKVESNYGGVYVAKYTPIGGMTLRDYFIVTSEGLERDQVALAELLAGEPAPKPLSIKTAQWWAKANAIYKAMNADAMLAERDK